MLNQIAQKLKEILDNQVTGVTIVNTPVAATEITQPLLMISFAKHTSRYLDVLRNKRELTFDLIYVNPSADQELWETQMRQTMWAIMEAIESNPTLDELVAWAGEIQEGKKQEKLSEELPRAAYVAQITCIVNCPTRNQL